MMAGGGFLAMWSGELGRGGRESPASRAKKTSSATPVMRPSRPCETGKRWMISFTMSSIGRGPSMSPSESSHAPRESASEARTGRSSTTCTHPSPTNTFEPVGALASMALLKLSTFASEKALRWHSWNLIDTLRAWAGMDDLYGTCRVDWICTAICFWRLATSLMLSSTMTGMPSTAERGGALVGSCSLAMIFLKHLDTRKGNTKMVRSWQASSCQKGRGSTSMLQKIRE
mmetsp:Transcript_63744/g.201617  ORF Transcript_63744/g.201617 Transcript_63744/m.201617 type:complete len:230 (+) Transcript_63744:1746-2435(+)